MYDDQSKPESGGLATVTSKRASITDRLITEKRQLETRLSEINVVLGKLEKNPEVQDIIDSLSKVIHF